jgi:hypothetical protein
MTIVQSGDSMASQAVTGMVVALRCRHVVVGTRFCASAPYRDEDTDAQKRVPTEKPHRPPAAGCRDAPTRQALGTRTSASLRKNPTDHQPPGAGMRPPGRRWGRAQARPYGKTPPATSRRVPGCAHPAGGGDAHKRVPTGKIYRPPAAGCRDAPTRQALWTRTSASLRKNPTGHHPPGVEMRAPGRRYGRAQARPYGKTPPATTRRVPRCAHPAGVGDAQKRVPTGKIHRPPAAGCRDAPTRQALETRRSACLRKTPTGHQPPGAGMHPPGRRWRRAQARPYGENPPDTSRRVPGCAHPAGGGDALVRVPTEKIASPQSPLSTQHSALSTTKELTTCQPVLC